MRTHDYCRAEEWSGYTVRAAAAGWVVSTWSRIQGNLTGRRVLVRWAAFKGAGYDADTPLADQHNAIFTVGDIIADYARTAHTKHVRVLRTGHRVA